MTKLKLDVSTKTSEHLSLKTELARTTHLLNAEKQALSERIKQLEEKQKQTAADLEKNSFKLEGQAEVAKKASEKRIKSLEEQAQRERDSMKAEKERLSEVR
ncbi:hypothetical protein DXG01_016454 [Tephrocybe rancida]|nr:hypothetical protein DXG01_016454 [Tephrocybe rancida]